MSTINLTLHISKSHETLKKGFRSYNNNDQNHTNGDIYTFVKSSSHIIVHLPAKTSKYYDEGKRTDVADLLAKQSGISRIYILPKLTIKQRKNV